jgi:toxin FitB
VIVLDTNVLSELMLYAPDLRVQNWLNQLPGESVWTTSVTVFELRFGLLGMQRGRKRRFREDALLALHDELLDGRILDFNSLAAEKAAEIASDLKANGRAVDVRDAMIAGIVAAKRATLATRNTKHFEATGIRLVNPWLAP